MVKTKVKTSLNLRKLQLDHSFQVLNHEKRANRLEPAQFNFTFRLLQTIVTPISIVDNWNKASDTIINAVIAN